jgi:hypothetical protein
MVTVTIGTLAASGGFQVSHRDGHGSLRSDRRTRTQAPSRTRTRTSQSGGQGAPTSSSRLRRRVCGPTVTDCTAGVSSGPQIPVPVTRRILTFNLKFARPSGVYPYILTTDECGASATSPSAQCATSPSAHPQALSHTPSV